MPARTSSDQITPHTALRQLATLRVAAGINRPKLARRVGLTAAGLRFWETLARPPAHAESAYRAGLEAELCARLSVADEEDRRVLRLALRALEAPAPMTWLAGLVEDVEEGTP